MKKRALLTGPAVLIGTLFAGAAAAQSNPGTTAAPPAPPPKSCAAPENRQLDFWVGEWEAVDVKTGTVLGTSSITGILDGCVIQERWSAAGGAGTGTSLSLYDKTDQKWHYTWVDDKGSLLLLTGGMENGTMVMTGQAPDKTGTVTWRRLTWAKMAPDRVHQTYATSADGKAWAMAFDGVYVAKKPAAGK